MVEESLASLLNPSQKRRLTVTLLYVEKALRQVEQTLDGGGSGVLYETVGVPDEARRQAIRGVIRQIQTELAGLARDFQLEPTRENAAAAIAALMSSAWEGLEDCRPASLRRYGAVNPGLQSALGPRIERLAELTLRATREAGAKAGREPGG
jgi:hypothetical protein